MGHEVGNLPSNGSDKKKKSLYLQRENGQGRGERKGENDKANVIKCQQLMNRDERFIAVLCAVLATFLKFEMKFED